MALRVLTVAFALFAACHSSLAQANTNQLNSGIIYGHGYAFSVTAPRGWVLDNISGGEQGLDAVFYPQGSSWRQSKVVMYAHAVPKDDRASRTLQQVIQSDIRNLKAESPKIGVTSAKGLLTRAKSQAVVKYFSGTFGGNWEAVAYMNERRVVTELVLSARTQTQFETSLPVFRQLVGSYWFVTDKIKFVRPTAYHKRPKSKQP